MWSRRAIALGIAAGLCAIAGPGLAAKRVIPLTTGSLSTYDAATEGLGHYYVLEVDLPAGLEGPEIYAAMLEFYVDVQTVELRDGYYNDTPRIEVYALKSEMGSALDPDQLQNPAMSVVNIPTGENRRVKVDVTEAVRTFVKEPSKNYGFVLGSLTGSRDGLFTVKTNTMGEGVVGTLAVHYR